MGLSHLADISARIIHHLRQPPSGTSSGPEVPRSVAIKLTGHEIESIHRRYAIVPQAGSTVP